MRVRYDKPIKAINLSDVTESFSTTSAISLLSGCGGQWASNTHKSYLYQQLSTRRTHKVFMLYQVNSSSLPALSDVMRLIIVRANGNSVMGEASVYKTNNMYYGVASIGTGTSSDAETSDTWLQLNSGKTFIANTSYTWFMIDLTNSFGSGNEPTAQQFYNKYNKYFSLIATGQEITIDDKAGQVSYAIEEGTTNLGGTSTTYSTKTHGQPINCSSWGGDAGTCTFYHYGGYNNYPYKVYHKTSTGTGGIFQNTSRDIVIEEGKTYTMSVYIKASRNISSASAHTFNINRATGNYYITYGKSFNITTEWQRLSKTFTATSADAGTDYSEMSILYDDGAEDYYVYYSGFQIEEKDHATPFVIGTRPNNYPISCKIAGGSSDIYYGYNQLFYTNGINARYQLTVTQNDTSFHCKVIDNWTSGPAYFGIDNYFDFVEGHKYYVSFTTTRAVNVLLANGTWVYSATQPFIVTCGVASGTTKSRFFIYTANQAASIEYDISNINCIDLTNWYGNGKEPSTVQEFKEKFAKDYYGCCLTPIKLTRYQIEALPNYGYNQLFVSTTSTANWISNGTTLTFNDDESVTMVRYNNNNYDGIQMVSSKASSYYNTHKYFWACDVYADTKAGNGAGFGLNLYSSGSGYAIQENQAIPEKTWYRDEKIFIPTKNSSGTIYPWIFMNQRNDRTVGDKIIVKNVMFIDLTDWYGSGSEPTTIDEFKQTFPNKYYSYSKKRLLNKYMINKLID